ncbi:MAG TPA: DUF6049 family protein, partial [Actinomycetota bacterium]|nr:DUF6049 family protein [Actinomycetota bacterium]
WADSEPFQDTIAPGQTTLLNFDLGKTPVEYSRFATQSSLDRAYPVRFTVDVDAVPETSLLTEMIYFQEAQVATPLDLSMVIPLDTPSVLNPQGQETSRALESAIAPGGRIANILGALQEASASSLRVALAPTGKLLESLAVLAAPAGFTRITRSGPQQVPPTDPAAQNAGAALRAIQLLVARGTVRLIATPYSLSPLPGLIANGLTGDVSEQVQDDVSTVRTVLGPNVDTLPGWLLPTDGLVDDATLAQLVGLGDTNMLLAPASLEQPSSLPQLTPSAQVTAVAGRSQTSVGALVEDTALTDLLTPSGDLSPAQVLEQFLADTATIQQEQPGLARTVSVVTPADWDPDPVVLSGLFAALTPITGAPWMTGVTPDAATTGGTLLGRVVVQNVSEDGLVTPPKAYFTALHTARQRLDEFKTLAPPGTMVDQLTAQLLVAEGEEWWGKASAASGGEAFARYVANWVSGQLAKIQVGDQTYTITSKGAEIPLGVDSGLSYTVKVVLYLASDKLNFQQGGACPGIPATQATCLMLALQPRLQTIRVRAVNTLSGRFPVQVEVRTLNNATISQGRLLIRSTAYNFVALGIVGAAALFILANWVWGLVRRRIAAARPPQVFPEPPPAPAGPSESA